MRRAWVLWALALVVSFAILETIALSFGMPTLSQSVVDLSYAWPPFPFVLGLIVGFLACHFFWHWVPKQRRETCARCGKQILKDMIGG